MITNTFTIGSRKYEYTLGKPFHEDGVKLMHFSCPKLEIDQDFLVEDVPELILDLPNIAYNLKQSSKQNTFLRVRIKMEEKMVIEKKAMKEGKTMSVYIREKVLGQ
ncbi:MAG: hypothetical protein OEL89_02115 [Candidatus Peregrinibacteria bacterium]|nr:hypothetical protein [Candidatus Peregrinibacteria bacterium]